MMLARAPGKLVLSGAYAVLDGAPAIVSAIDRYVVADSSATSPLRTPEFSAACSGPQPYFDANHLRQDGHKLGLGSSAAILVACLGALGFSEAPDKAAVATIREAVYTRALYAHRRAQGGGSGIDVAASSFGGTLLARQSSVTSAQVGLQLKAANLPKPLVLQVWATGRPASTSELVARVRALKQNDGTTYEQRMRPQAEAAEAAADAMLRGSTHEFIAALAQQHAALRLLGEAAGTEIVVDAVRQLHRLAQNKGACVLPAGAGGGDISLYAGVEPPDAELCSRARRLGQKPLNLGFGALGLMPLAHAQADET